MASKRNLKKHLGKMIIDVVEESYSIQLYNPKEKAKKTDKLIDEVLDFHDDMRTKIKAAKSKKDFAPLRQNIENKGNDFYTSLEGLY